ncbi:hypothetical protein ACFYVL_44000 [Streptomyces sp. NPDC004111]|uniref:hypothetical protein n=1 Tax=Streptomyces sp. NPDC004111 TaxID=3364690 RepID=UPI003694C0BB
MNRSLNALMTLILLGCTFLLLVGGGTYLAWQHPGAAVPIGVGAAIGTLFVTVVGVVVAVATRNRQ